MFVYVIERGDRKIGISGNPHGRALSLSGKLEFALECAPEYAAHAEARAHNLLEKHRSCGEWFAVSKRRAIAAVKEATAWAAEGNQHPNIPGMGAAGVVQYFREWREPRIAEAARFWGAPRRMYSTEWIAKHVDLGKTTIARYLGSRERFRDAAPDDPGWMKGEDIAFKVGKSLRTLHNKLGPRGSRNEQ